MKDKPDQTVYIGLDRHTNGPGWRVRWMWDHHDIPLPNRTQAPYVVVVEIRDGKPEVASIRDYELLADVLSVAVKPKAGQTNAQAVLEEPPPIVNPVYPVWVTGPWGPRGNPLPQRLHLRNVYRGDGRAHPRAFVMVEGVRWVVADKGAGWAVEPKFNHMVRYHREFRSRWPWPVLGCTQDPNTEGQTHGTAQPE